MTEHVKPSRDDVARATFDAFHSAYVPRVHWDEAPRFVLDNHRDLADAVLALLPGRTEAEVAAATLRAASEALDAMQTPEAGLPADVRRDPALWLMLRADQIEKGEGQ